MDFLYGSSFPAKNTAISRAQVSLLNRDTEAQVVDVLQSRWAGSAKPAIRFAGVKDQFRQEILEKVEKLLSHYSTFSTLSPQLVNSHSDRYCGMYERPVLPLQCEKKNRAVAAFFALRARAAQS